MADDPKIKILVVDDEIHITTLLKINLEICGFVVDVARDGVEALERVDANPPNLILLDIKMPRLNGWQVCEKLKADEKTSEIPIIMVTAFGQNEARQRSFDLGADEFMAKPFESSALLDIINTVIKKRNIQAKT